MASVIPESEMGASDGRRAAMVCNYPRKLFLWQLICQEKAFLALVNCPTKSRRECLLPAGIKSAAVICRRYSKAFTADKIVSGSHLP
uniref:Uncharacterized protein n=1 Tax=Oryza barthii TaxID=65489 RepID=A0A0D3H5H5_9ORYZ